MANCIKCWAELPAGAVFCPACGKSQTPKQRKRRTRGNGIGSVYQRPNKTWVAVVTLGYVPDPKTKRLKRKTRSKAGFRTKTEAIEYLPHLKAQPANVPKDITFQQLYDRWLPLHERDVTRDTMNCYKAAFKHFEPIWFVKMSELKTAALQDCLDNCGKGKRTQQNMKALGTMLYREAMKDDLVKKNYAELLNVGGGAQSPREPFAEEELNIMWQKYTEIPNLDLVLILCYTGFRLDEFLSLTGQDLREEVTEGEKWWYFIGGEKTEAGRERMVAISPKIVPLVMKYRKPGYLFSADGRKVSTKKFREDIYYPALLAAGLPKRVPHCCRHTYATLMKNVEGVSDKDKMASIGHTSKIMTNRYTHADKKIPEKAC